MTLTQQQTQPMVVALPLNATVMTVAPAQAKEWLDSMGYDHQRRIRSHHVEYLAEEMRRNRFIQGTQIHLVRFDGRYHLVDGQHRLQAVVTAGMAQSFSVLTTEVQTKEDMAWVYGSTDIGMKRTSGDLLGALEMAGELDLKADYLGRFSAAIIFLASGCISQSHIKNDLHRDDMVKYMRLYAPYAREFYDLSFGAPGEIRRGVTRVATFSVALLTLRFSAERAAQRGDPSISEFWKGAIFDDSIPIGDPRKVAHRHLLTTAMPSGRGVMLSSTVSAAYSSRYLVNCVNAYMERRDLKMGRVNDQRAPIALYGAPADPAEWLKDRSV